MHFGDLHARLDEGAQKMLAATLIGIESGDGEVTVDHGRSCLEALRMLNNRMEPAGIKIKIREAERAGNIVEALRLMQLL
jgi:hypothetical protein